MSTKREFLTAWALAWVASVSCAACPLTAFDLSVQHFWALILYCGLATGCGSLLFTRRRGDLIAAGLLALAAGYLWHLDAFWQELSSLLAQITRRYHQAYGWGVVTLKGYPTSGPVDLPLQVIGILAGLSVSYVMLRRRSVLYTLPALILPLSSCLVVTDTPPHALWLYLLLVCLALLLMTDYTRRKGTHQAATLTALLALPVALGLGLLFLLCPQERYVNNAGRYEQQLVHWFQNLTDTDSVSADPVISNGQAQVALNTLGPRTEWNYITMEVTSSQNGLVYLRGQEYDTYSGTSWSATTGRTESFGGGVAEGTITIQTRSRHSLRYLPYYPAVETVLTDGHLDNDNAKQYSFSMTASGVSPQPDSRYLSLPAATEKWAAKLVARILADPVSDQAGAASIGDFVRSSALYALDTPKMPGEQSDFARWFLENSDTGYCVHFATATVVLLRAAGIPARYVTGYVVNCAANTTVEVPERNAHAWAEYYDATQSRWVVLESTPADLAVPLSTVTDPEAETQPVLSPSLASSDPAEPSQADPSAETGADIPSGPTAPAASFQLPRWANGVLWVLLALALLLGQSFLRWQLAQQQWDLGRPNRRALRRWLQVQRLSRLLGVKPPRTLESLAQKAKFSQHALTGGELEQFNLWRSQALVQLRRKPFLQRLFQGIFFGVW